MKYKLLILFALITSVLLSGCINPVDNSGNFTTSTNTQPTPTSKLMADRIIPIDQKYDDGTQILVYHIEDNGHKYTCFYIQGAGNLIAPSLSCTRDIQAVN